MQINSVFAFWKLYLDLTQKILKAGWLSVCQKLINFLAFPRLGKMLNSFKTNLPDRKTLKESFSIEEAELPLTWAKQNKTMYLLQAPCKTVFEMTSNYIPKPGKFS